MRALTSFLNPTVTLELSQSIITHFSFKWKFSRLVISSIMDCSHLKEWSALHCTAKGMNKKEHLPIVVIGAHSVCEI